MKKKIVSLIVTATVAATMAVTCIPSFAAERPVDPIAVVEDIPTIQFFTEEPVSEEDLAIIVNAGVNAPSGVNSQPWHFAVVTDPAVLDDIANGAGDSSGDSAGDSAEDAAAGDSAEDTAGDSEGDSAETADISTAEGRASVGDSPVAIIISCKDGSELDAGLACQNMSVAAQLLGYGTKIVSSPTMVLNGARQDEFRELLGIPADQTIVTVLLIGVSAQDEADIVSSATGRNPIEDVVTYIMP